MLVWQLSYPVFEPFLCNSWTDLSNRIIEEEAGKVEGGYEKIVLAGISQGAAVSVHTLLNLNLPPGRHLAAFLGFSCRMPFPGRSLGDTRNILGLEGVPEGDGVIRGTPILLEHCVDDPLVLVEWGRGLRDSLGAFGARVTWKEYPDGGHWFNSPRGMDDAVAFLGEVVELKGEGAGGSKAADEMDLS
jgi:predicted esterase